MVVPGLLGPWSESDLPGFPMPSAPALGRFLGCADRCPRDADFYRAVSALHGIDTEIGRDPPIASICRLLDAAGRRR